eukprot:CAMPEP_0197621780 /NCGR_PEP_ID=MMETSP1338-20131121/2247_1 /TAXON_ID=43686 ORGANISM="Pelagodinium beii, Strain RCC1491" /NCGR_SAMPLE_ID=MMETSP1338 /ASSEMBLY_ACC=CAM_ASM_000754 /LENGTH=184 /DNA_ID=CAMNT_0043191321 /DNA_START=92 /DNA_END=643 /DNA_ORIENTATION=+
MTSAVGLAALGLAPAAAFVTPLAEPQTSTALRGSAVAMASDAPEAAPMASTGLAAVAVAATTAGVAASRRRNRGSTMTGAAKVVGQVNAQAHAATRSLRNSRIAVYAGADLPEGRKLRVAVVGGGPSGACCADELAKQGMETYLIERKMDNCKPCGGAIPLCMLDEFDLPTDIVDRQVRKMTMI